MKAKVVLAFMLHDEPSSDHSTCKRLGPVTKDSVRGPRVLDLFVLLCSISMFDFDVLFSGICFGLSCYVCDHAAIRASLEQRTWETGSCLSSVDFELFDI